MTPRILLLTLVLVCCHTGIASAQTRATAQSASGGESDRRPAQSTTASSSSSTGQSSSQSSTQSTENSSRTSSDAACATACTYVNNLDDAARSTPASVRPTVEQVMDKARETVNDVCDNSCSKPPISSDD